MTFRVIEYALQTFIKKTHLKNDCKQYKREDTNRNRQR